MLVRLTVPLERKVEGNGEVTHSQGRGLSLVTPNTNGERKLHPKVTSLDLVFYPLPPVHLLGQ